MATLSMVVGAVGGAIAGRVVHALFTKTQSSTSPVTTSTSQKTNGQAPITPSKELAELLQRFVPTFGKDPIFLQLYETVTLLEYLDEDSQQSENKYTRSDLQFRAKVLTDTASKMIRQVKNLAVQKRVNPIDFKNDIADVERVVQDYKKNILQQSMLLRETRSTST